MAKSLEECNRELSFWTEKLKEAQRQVQWWLDEQKLAMEEERRRSESRNKN
jgi:hypothetical protein